MESGDEDELGIASRDWDRLQDNMYKAGFRDGASEQKQNAFDLGVEWGLMYGAKIGKLLQLIREMIENDSDNAVCLKLLGGKVKAHALECETLKVGSNNLEDDGKIRVHTTEHLEMQMKSFLDELKTLKPQSSKLIDDTMAMTISTSKRKVSKDKQKVEKLKNSDSEKKEVKLSW